MSDFLSKFNKDEYDDLVSEQVDDKAKKEKVEQASDKESTEEEVIAAGTDESAVKSNSKPITNSYISTDSYQDELDDDVEIDMDYRNKKRRKLWLIIAGSVLACLLLFLIYYMVVHVKAEDFVGDPVSEARVWAKENDIEIKLEQEHSMEYDVNQVISQSVPAGKKIKKGKTLELISSLGPDPEDVIPLEDFSIMSREEAANWIVENKAENLQLVTEYSDDIDEGEFIKLTINDPAVKETEYRRKDKAAIYYSKGQEIFEKNITIPNFIGLAKEEVEKWAETNEIEMTYKDADSDSVETGNVISQSEAADGKIAKREKFEVVVSVGKAAIVPNFWGLTADEAASNYPDLDVTVKQVYHAEVSYGTLISQSVSADTKLTESDDKHVTVTYSQGRPYLQDFRGLLEGDLPRLFYDEYQSKGAKIKYNVRFVDSHEIKGTVVRMSKFNEFVPMNYTVQISISNNAYAEPNPPDFSDDEPMDVEEVEEFEIHEK